MILKHSHVKQVSSITSELNKDQSYNAGTILSSMNSEADISAKEVFIQHLESNLGDPALFPGTQNIEAQTIKILGELFDLPSSGTGRILTGGSEANITALWAIRNKVRKKFQETPHTQLEISYLPPLPPYCLINSTNSG